MLKIIGKADMGEIKPNADYFVVEYRGEEYLIRLEENLVYTEGKVVDIVSNPEKAMEYREKGFCPVKIEKNRTAIIRILPLKEGYKLCRKFSWF